MGRRGDRNGSGRISARVADGIGEGAGGDGEPAGEVSGTVSDVDGGRGAGIRRRAVVMPRERPVIVRRLDVTVYTDGGRSWHVETTAAPAWSVVEQAVRQLDKFSHPFLFLCLSEAEDADERLEIRGGNGDYWIAGDFDGFWQRRIVNPNGSDERVMVWTSDQGFGDADRHICHDVEVVVRAARYFFDHGHFDPSLTWEEQQ